MLDLAFIRKHPDIVKEAARVKYNTLDIDYLLDVDRRVLEVQRQVEEARTEQNKISKRIQQAGKDKAERDALIAEGKQLAEQIKAMEPRLHELEEERYQLLLLVPNIPDPSSPIGKDESDNVPIRYWGEKPSFDFEPLDHYGCTSRTGSDEFRHGSYCTQRLHAVDRTSNGARLLLYRQRAVP